MVYSEILFNYLLPVHSPSVTKSNNKAPLNSVKIHGKFNFSTMSLFNSNKTLSNLTKMSNFKAAFKLFCDLS